MGIGYRGVVKLIKASGKVCLEELDKVGSGLGISLDEGVVIAGVGFLGDGELGIGCGFVEDVGVAGADDLVVEPVHDEVRLVI